MEPKYSSRDTNPSKPSSQKLIQAKRTAGKESAFAVQTNSQKLSDFKVSPRNNQRT
jgi:hypothetical protein